jgi:hypothetical protein
MEFKFSQVLHECIINGLKDFLGETGMKAVLFNIELGQYIDDPREFHANLYAIFNQGAFSLEKAIVKELFRRLNLTYVENRTFDFARQVSQARELSMKTRKENRKRFTICNHNSKS